MAARSGCPRSAPPASPPRPTAGRSASCSPPQSTSGVSGHLATLLCVSRRASYALLAAIVALPRLIALVAERGDILTAFTDKSDDFARTFLDSGTYGFVAGHPSAYTQPLYGFFFVPIYWVFGRHWEVVGIAQILV